jgi:hypothetical protein
MAATIIFSWLLDASLSNEEKCMREGFCVEVQQVRINPGVTEKPWPYV